MSKQILTHRKAAWQAQFKPKVLVGQPLQVNAGVVAWYQKKLEKLVAELETETRKEVEALFAELAAPPAGASMDASLASQGRMVMNRLRRRFHILFAQKAREMAAGMILRTDKATSASLHASLKDLSGGLSLKTSTMPPALKEAVKATVSENVRLIKSIAEKHLSKVEGAVMRSIVSGKGLADLVPQLEKIGKVSKSTARTVARDQINKAHSTYEKHRLLAAGFTKFKWLHSGGGKVPRHYHKAPAPEGLNGGIFDLADPPVIDQATGEKGMPRQLWGCRCCVAPVIVFDEGE